jgi:Pyruvate:ferredoxin oxidoreductase and related 2-oxoacid:ferredoxin oxidoreductases, gamma subunit
MSQSAVEKHLKDLKEKGVLIADEDTVEHIPETKAKVFRITATRVAKTDLKSGIYTNVVLLGALVRITGIVTAESIEKAIGDIVPQESLEKNLKGFKRGRELAG